MWAHFQRLAFQIHSNGEQLAQLKTILLAQELVPQDCSSHSAENQRPNLPVDADVTLSPQFTPPPSYSFSEASNNDSVIGAG